MRPRLWGCFGGLAGLLATVAAASPPVRFDVEALAAAREVTTEEFRLANPNEALFEVRLNISSLIPGGPSAIDHYLYRVESPHASLLVVDYLPQTTLATEVVGHVGVDSQRENTRSFSLDVSGKYDSLVAGSAGSGATQLNRAKLSYELLPKLELLAASGTIGRGAGVYFKLKPSPQTSLEGARLFVLILRANADWRADELVVRCEAVGREADYESPVSVLTGSERLVAIGRREFVVRLYREGDEAARQAAWDVVLAERDFVESLTQERTALTRLANADLKFRLGRLPSLRAAALPTGWLDECLAAPQRATVYPFYNDLPTRVQAAWDDYAAARDALGQISGDKSSARRERESRY